MDILEHLGMLVPDIEGHGVITGRANRVYCSLFSIYNVQYRVYSVKYRVFIVYSVQYRVCSV